MSILVYTDDTASIKFVRCDVTNWDDQVNLFHTAASMTSSGTIDHVVANAGIAIEDEVFSYDGMASAVQRLSAKANARDNRSGVPFEASQSQNGRSESPWCFVYHQTRHAHFHRTERNRRSLLESDRHQSHPHRFWGCFS